MDTFITNVWNIIANYFWYTSSEFTKTSDPDHFPVMDHGLSIYNIDVDYARTMCCKCFGSNYKSNYEDLHFFTIRSQSASSLGYSPFVDSDHTEITDMFWKWYLVFGPDILLQNRSYHNKHYADRSLDDMPCLVKDLDVEYDSTYGAMISPRIWQILQYLFGDGWTWFHNNRPAFHHFVDDFYTMLFSYLSSYFGTDTEGIFYPLGMVVGDQNESGYLHQMPYWPIDTRDNAFLILNHYGDYALFSRTQIRGLFDPGGSSWYDFMVYVWKFSSAWICAHKWFYIEPYEEGWGSWVVDNIDESGHPQLLTPLSFTRYVPSTIVISLIYEALVSTFQYQLLPIDCPDFPLILCPNSVLGS